MHMIRCHSHLLKSQIHNFRQPPEKISLALSLISSLLIHLRYFVPIQVIFCIVHGMSSSSDTHGLIYHISSAFGRRIFHPVHRTGFSDAVLINTSKMR